MSRRVFCPTCALVTSATPAAATSSGTVTCATCNKMFWAGSVHVLSTIKRTEQKQKKTVSFEDLMTESPAIADALSSFLQ